MTAAAGNAAELTAADYPILNAIAAISAASLLSHSAYARVYRVTSVANGECVVKLVAASVATDVGALCQALSGVPGLNLALATGELHGYGYLVYPYHPRTLADVIEAGPRAAGEVAHLLGPVAHAIEAMHAIGGVHGDIKPANVFIDTAGRAVLGDLDGSLPVGAVANRVTPGFTAPELALGGEVTPSADYYSFATTVAAALVGPRISAPGRNQWLPLLDSSVRPAIAADLDSDPAKRTARPAQLIELLRSAAPGPGWLPPALPEAGDVPPADGPGAQSTAGPQPDGAGAYEVWPNPERELVVAAERIFGPVDLRAPTVDRLSLRIHPDPKITLDDQPGRPIWRRPAMVAALAAAFALVIVAIVLVAG